MKLTIVLEWLIYNLERRTLPNTTPNKILLRKNSMGFIQFFPQRWAIYIK